MTDPIMVDEGQAREMSREEALRTLAASGDRMAQLMLAGPEIGSGDQHLVSPGYTKRLALPGMVARALREMRVIAQAEREQGLAELRALGGLHG